MSDHRRNYYINRTLCEVLSEIRDYVKVSPLATTQKNVILSLVAEIQIIGDRMESGPGDKKDLLAMNKEWHDLRREVKELRKEKKRLSSEE